MKAMKLNKVVPVRWLAGICSLGVLLMFPQVGFGQQAKASSGANAPVSPSSLMPGAASARPAVTPDAEEESPKPSSAGHQGIHVHGHWVIDVRNPDGTLVEHRDFHNSLTSGGAAGTAEVSTGDQYLVALISGSAVPSPLGIAFIQGQNGAATLNAVGDTTGLCGNRTGITCGFWSAANSFLPNAGSGMNVTANFAPAASLVLSGNYTVPSNLTGIDAVQSYFEICAASALGATTGTTAAMKGSVAFGTGNIAPNACYSGSSNSGITLPGTLTYTLVNNNAGVPTRLVVTPGQILSVIVTISFS